MFSQIKDMKHIQQNFHSVTWVIPQGWDLGVLWGQKLERGDLRWRHIDCTFQFLRLLTAKSIVEKLAAGNNCSFLGIFISTQVGYYYDIGPLSIRQYCLCSPVCLIIWPLFPLP